MSELEVCWIHLCQRRKEDYVIVVDNDCAFVNDLRSGACVFEFNHYGWQLALDLFLHLGCNAEEA
jgi:hypothetical protein